VAAPVVLAVGMLGCNVLDGVGPSAGDIDALLAEARTALTNGHPARAVRLLERAHETDSTNAEVRVELTNALYAARDVDVFTLRAAVERLNGTEATVAGKGGGRACTDAAAPARSPDRFAAVPFGRAEALRRLADHQALLRRASQLLVDGVLARRPEAFAALAPKMQAKGYLLAGLTSVGRHLVRVRTAVLDTESTLYLDTEAAPTMLVACSPTPAARAQVTAALCGLRREARQALAWLRARNDRLRSGQTTLLIEALRRHADRLRGPSSCEPPAEPRFADALPQDRPDE
jgi:hypothetical protein